MSKFLQNQTSAAPGFEESSIGIIPARGGSKRIPKKNIINFLGEPLIAHTIKAALASKLISRTIVTTDDEEIAAVSRDYGAEVIMREAFLSSDEAKNVQVVDHLVGQLSLSHETLTLLQPTSPLRNKTDIDKCVQLFFEHPINSVCSVTKMETHPSNSMNINENEILEPYFGDPFSETRENELSQTYRQNGAIYVINAKVLSQQKAFLVHPCRGYLMPRSRSVDVDEPIDLAIGELLFRSTVK